MTIAKAEVALRGKDETAAAFRSVVRNAEAMSRDITAKFRGAFGIGAGALITGAFFRINSSIKAAVSQASDIQGLAQAFGSTVEEISRLDFAAKQSNTSIQEVAGSFQKLFQSISKAEDGSKRQVAALERLKLSARGLMGLPLSQQIGVISDAFNDVKNPVDRARIAQDLFGGSVTRIVPLLQQGSEGLRRLGEESDRTGATLTKEVAARLEATEKEFLKVEAASMALKRELAIGLGPAVETMGQTFLTAAKGAMKFGEDVAAAIHGPDTPVGILQEQLEELVDRRAELLATIRRLEAQPELLAPGALENWKTQLRAVEAEMNRVNSALQQFGKDAAAAEAFKPVEQGAARAASAVEILRKLIADISEQVGLEIPIIFGDPGAIFGPGFDEENARVLRERFHAIMRENIPLQERTIQINEKIIENTKETTDEYAEHWLEAHRRIENSLAAFYRNLDSGRDFIRGFLDTIADTLANNAAAMTMDALGIGEKSKGGWLARLFGMGGGEKTAEAPRASAAERAAEIVGKIKDSNAACQCIHEALMGSSQSILGGLDKVIGASQKNTGEVLGGIGGAASSINANAVNVGTFLGETMWAVEDFKETKRQLDDVFGAIFEDFGGNFAQGGELAPGKWGWAGEDGPEPIVGGRYGKTIVPLTAMRSGAPQYHIDARSTIQVDARYMKKDAAEELIKNLPEILKLNNRALEQHIVTGLRRRRYSME